MEKILFLDIETHRFDNWEDLSPLLQKAFINHNWNRVEFTNVESCFAERAGLLPEFSRVICVSMGYEGPDGLVKTTISGKNEVEILTKLSQILDAFLSRKYVLAGHNIKGFDIPFLCKRYIINKLPIPKMINFMGAKPWEINVIDTMEMWKFGSWNSVSLETICAVLGRNSKKAEVTGGDLWLLDVEEINFDDLGAYCEDDVEDCYYIYKTIKSYV